MLHSLCATAYKRIVAGRIPEVVADKLEPKAASPMVESARKGGLLPSRTSTAGTGAPASFYCPISMELMADPVMVATGHTYDRWASLAFSSGMRGWRGLGELQEEGSSTAGNSQV